MRLIDNIPVFGEADDKTLNQMRTCAKTAYKVALMPDNHLGYGVPIGGVVAYKGAISPTGVGYDIDGWSRCQRPVQGLDHAWSGGRRDGVPLYSTGRTT